MIQNSQIPSIIKNFNSVSKSKKMLRASVLAILASMPVISSSAELENININNPNEVTEFVQQEAASFLQSYKVKMPTVLQTYISNESNKKTTINLTTKEEAVIYNTTSKSFLDLTKATKKHNISKYDDDSSVVTLGNTSGINSVKFNSKMGGRVSPEYTFLWLDKLNISYNLKQTVSIASELQEYTCEKERVKQHEQQHVAFNEASFRAYHTISKEFYNKALDPINKIRIPASQNDYRDVLEQSMTYISMVMKDLNVAKIATSRKLHDMIDSKSSYRDIANETKRVCGENPQLSLKLRQAIYR